MPNIQVIDNFGKASEANDWKPGASNLSARRESAKFGGEHQEEIVSMAINDHLQTLKNPPQAKKGSNSFQQDPNSFRLPNLYQNQQPKPQETEAEGAKVENTTDLVQMIKTQMDQIEDSYEFNSLQEIESPTKNNQTGYETNEVA